MSEVKTYNSYEDIEDKIYVPSFQRDLNLELVADIKKYIYERYKQKLHLCIGVLDFCKYNAQLFVVNGQHRVKALEEFYKETGNEIKFHAIIYTVTSQEEMQEIFKLLNSGLKVPDFILNLPTDKQKLIRKINKFILELSLTKI